MKQPYRIQLHADSGFVRVDAFGEITRSVGEQIITEARKLAAENDCSLLYDVREATVKVDFSRYFFMPRELEVLTTAPTRQVKVAILIPAEQAQEYSFYETAAGNVGLSVKIFLDENEAIAWLQES